RRTGFALYFRRPAGDRRAAIIRIPPIFFPVALADLFGGGIDFLGIAAERTFERPQRGVEIELGATPRTGELPPRGRLAVGIARLLPIRLDITLKGRSFWWNRGHERLPSAQSSDA